MKRLLDRLHRLQRRKDLQTLLNAVEMRRLNSSEQTRFLERIMKETLTGAIAPQESRALTKAVTGEQEKHAP